MPLKFKVDTLDGVDEAVRPFYKQVEGGFQLDVEGAQGDAEVAGLKQALLTEREHNAEWKAFKAEHGTPTEARAKMADLASKGGKPNPDQQAILEQMKLDLQAAAE
ncbi:MAG: hypothetical protein AAFQ17_00800 [Pseudomonadota bacterium]